MRRSHRIAIAATAVAVTLLNVTGWAAPGGLDLSYAQPQVDCFPRLIPAEDGGLFAACADRIVDPRDNTVGRHDIKVYKFTADGSPDTAWGANGKSTHTINRLLPFGACSGTNCTLLLRDGGILVVLEDGEVARFDVRGRLVANFAKPQGFHLRPTSTGRSETGGWVHWRIIEAASGELRVLAYESKLAELRDQLIAVRRFSSSGMLLDENIYRAELDILASDSGGRVADVTSVVLGFWNGNLQLAQPIANLERWAQVELMPGGGQVGAPVFNLGAMSDYDARIVIQSPDGRLAMPQRFDKVNEWTSTGQLNSAFADRGAFVPTRLSSGWCMDLFGIHSNGQYSVRLRSAFFTRGASCGAPYGLLLQGGTGAATPLHPFASNDAAMDARGNYYYAMQAAVGSSTQLIRTEGFGPLARVKVVEYYAPANDRYFITAHPHEINDLDKPATGWQRTGRYFHAWNIDTPMPGTNIVCRYYGDLQAGPNSHFFSAQAYECDLLREIEAGVPLGNSAWRFERDAFRITPPVNGRCENGLFPITRFYNGKSGERGVPNHRYVTRQPDIEEMTAKGWINEGVRMCAVL